jgi:hypothetical protein
LSYRLAIAEEIGKITLVKDWETILGEYLYAAIKTSKTRKIEEHARRLKTNAVKI